jgi:dipeptidyl aminopeptidase/acylaminoacyl peptidase
MKRFSLSIFRILFLAVILAVALPAGAQGSTDELRRGQQSLQEDFHNLRFRLDVLEKAIDDIQWHMNVGDVAYIDKLFMAGAPPRGADKASTLIETNPIKYYTYVFIPKDIDPSKKYPLLVFSHGGVHGDFDTYYTHIIRELMAQQYIVVAPEYRGSTGYGRRHHELIDYGGLENDDVHQAMLMMLDNYSIVDSRRVGLIGWSHGGMISMMNAFENPQHYKCAYAGVPVSDLVARMGYKRAGYEDLFSADYHIGQTVDQNIEEYRRRSLVSHAHKLNIPVLIHTNTIDEDVHVLEVENLINTLKAHNRQFEYEIFEEVPGGHSFDRMDHRMGRDIRFKVYKFLEKHLDPPRKFRNVREMEQAAYRFTR